MEEVEPHTHGLHSDAIERLLATSGDIELIFVCDSEIG